MANNQRLFLFTAIAVVLSQIIGIAQPALALTDAAPSNHGALSPDVGQLVAEVAIPKGSVVHPGKNRAVIVVVHNSGQTDATESGVKVRIPVGVRVTTKTAGWNCGERTKKGIATCSYASVIPAHDSRKVDLVLRTTRQTPPSVSEVRFTPFSSTEKKIVAKSSPFTVMNAGDPVMVPHVLHKQGKMKNWVEWVDGSVQKAYVNEKYTYRIRVRNEGLVEFGKGQIVRLSQKVGKGITLTSAVISRGDGNCLIQKKKVSCTVKADKSILPSQILGSVDVTIETHRAQDRLPLGPIKLYEPYDKGRRQAGILMTGIHRPNALSIKTHSRIDADAGGVGTFELHLDNGANGLTHSQYTVRAKLPNKIRFVSVRGDNWSCGVSGGHLSCTYQASIAPGKKSSMAVITYRALKSARVGQPAYSLEFRSAHAVAFLHILVRPALNISASASHTSVKTSANKSTNHVLLIGEVDSNGGARTSHKWEQRCITLQDSRVYEGCTDGIVTPKATILHSGHSRAQAVLPHVNKKTTFVFEYVAQNKSTKARRTVKVVAVDPSTAVASSSVAKAQATNNLGISTKTTNPFDRRTTSTTKPRTPSPDVNSVVTYDNVMPDWLLKTMENAHIDGSKASNVNNVVSLPQGTKASDVLPVSMRSRLSIDDSAPVFLTAQADDPTTCPVFTVGSTTAVTPFGLLAAVGMYVTHMDYVMTTQACKYHNDTFSKNRLRVTGWVFGDMLEYEGPVTWDPAFRYVGNISVSSWTIGKGASTLTLRDVGMILTIDDSNGSTTLGFNTGFAVFGTTLNLTGSITVPGTAGGGYLSGMMVSATLSTPQSIRSKSLDVRNLSLTLAVRWTPVLSSNRAWNDSALSDVWVSVIGAGDVEFLGTTLRFDKIEADFLAGVLSRVQMTMSANMNIPGMKVAKGDLTVVWLAGFPGNPDNKDLLGRLDPVAVREPSWEVEASMIFQTESGFSIGTEKNPATLSYKEACVAISGQVIVPGVLDATVSGFLVTGFPCGVAYMNIGTAAIKTEGHIASILDTLPMPIAEGDWRFDATNVKITVAGTTVSGNFSVGRVLQAPFGAIDATLQLGKSATNNVIKVQGELNPMSGFTLKGSGNLEVAGMVLNFNVDAAMTVTQQHIHATADLSVGATKVVLAGDFQYVKVGGVPIPTASFSADVSGFTVDGYGLGRAAFSLQQGVGTGGVSAALDINLGVLKASGSASFHTVPNGIVMSIDAVGSLGVSGKFSADVSAHVTNCATNACTSMGTLKVKATGSVTIEKRNFNLASIEFDSAGHFKVTTKYSGESCDQTGNIAGVEYRGCFEYDLSASLSDTSPYLRLSADVELDVDSRTRNSAKHKWNSWKDLLYFRSDIDVSFDPFKMSYKVGDINIRFSV